MPESPTPSSTPGRAEAPAVPCAHCEYELAGLAMAGVCPECGLAVADSVRRHRGLKHSTARHLSRMLLGLRLIIGATCGLALGAVIDMAFVFGISASATSIPIIVRTHTLFMLTCWMMMAAGLWLLTTAPPRGFGQLEWKSSRRVLRVSVAALVLCTLGNLLFVSDRAFPSGSLLMADVAVTGALTAFLVPVAVIAGFFAFIAYTKWLAIRVPDKRLCRRVDLLGYLVILWVVAGLIVASVWPEAMEVLWPLFPAALIAMVIFYVVILVQLHERLARLRRDQSNAVKPRDPAVAPTHTLP